LSAPLRSSPPHRDPRSFPTRRSSDLSQGADPSDQMPEMPGAPPAAPPEPVQISEVADVDLVPEDNGTIARLDGEPSVALMIMARSEEHTSELQSRFDLVCRLLLEKKK